MMQWMSWTLKIGDKAYKMIQPLAIEIRPQLEDFYSGYLWWRKTWTEKTGKWEIKFTYDTGPMTPRRTDVQVFDEESVAREWYDNIYYQVFAGQVEVPSMPKPKMKLPEIKKNSKPGLRLV
jgi:hypothetical protein